jgi:glycosyltransferase involved in cell wall biosynthesis
MNKKHIHIVHILPSLGFGGAERYVTDLINNSGADFRYTIVVFFDKIDLYCEITSSRVQIKKVLKKSKLGISFIFQLRKALVALKPDIIHTHLFAGDFWGRLAARSLGVPIITTEHNINDSEGFLKNKLRSWMRNYSDEYVACSQFVRSYAVKKYGIKKPYSVIYPGVAAQRFKNIIPLEFHRPLRLLLIGRLTQQKGQEFALRALAELKEFPWFLSIVGEGEDKKYLQGLVKELSISDSVIFLPPLKNVENVYEENDVVLVPSVWEGFGMVAAEALSSGRVAVASRVGGLPEIIEDGRTGFLFSKLDRKSFINTLSSIFRNKKIASQVAVQGQKYVQVTFTASNMAKQYENLYRKLKSS